MNKKTAMIIGVLCLVMSVNAIAFAIILSSKKPTSDPETTNSLTPTTTTLETLTPEVNTYTSEQLAEGFLNPSADYRLHVISHQFGASSSSAKALAKKYASLGVGGIVTNSAWNKKYLKSSTAFSSVSKALDQAENYGLKYWLYDEMGYPSGNAGGLTTIDHPEYVAKGLVWSMLPGQGMNAVTIKKPDDVTKIYSGYAIDANGKQYPATITEYQVSFNGVEGNWTLYMFCEKKLYEGTHAETNGWGGKYWLTRDYINLMDKDAVKHFIDITYAAYAQNLEQFKKVVGIFTDEPSLMECYQNNSDVHTYAQASWVDDFAEQFKAMHGYDINEKLHYLFGGTSEEAKTVRMNYRQTVAQLVSVNYFKQISDFCEANGTKSSGHLLLEEGIAHHVVYYGNLMQSIRQMGIPGVDILTGDAVAYMQESGGPYFMAPKYVASAARLAGKSNLVMVEICPVDKTYDYMDKATVDSLRGTLNMIFFSGVNHINSYVDPPLMGSRANDFADYFGRVSYMTRSSKWNGQIGMYYPIETVQMDEIPSKTSTVSNASNTIVSDAMIKLTLGLYAHQMDYNMVDDQFIREAQIKSGGYLTANDITFSVVLMPSVKAIPLDVLQKLLAFEKAGGTVIWVSKTPNMGDKMSDHAAVASIAKEFTVKSVNDSLFTSIKEAVKDPLKLEGALDTIYVSKYSVSNAPMYWLLNNSPSQKQFSINMDGDFAFDLYDPTTGEIIPTENHTTVTLNGYSTKFLIVKQR